MGSGNGERCCLQICLIDTLKINKMLILFNLLLEVGNNRIGKEQLSCRLSLCSPYDNSPDGKIRVTVSYLHDELATPTKS